MPKRPTSIPVSTKKLRKGSLPKQSRKMTMALAKKRNKEYIYRRLVEGLTQTEIAKELGITLGRVCQLVRESKEEAEASINFNMGELREQEIMRLKMILRKLYEEIQRSGSDKEKTVTFTDKDGGVTEEVTQEGRLVATELVKEYREYHTRLCLLYGIEPAKTNLVGIGGTLNVTNDELSRQVLEMTESIGIPVFGQPSSNGHGSNGNGHVEGNGKE